MKSYYEELGTQVFDENVMNHLIGFGTKSYDFKNFVYYIDPNINPECLNLQLWFDLIPNRFKNQSAKIMTELCEEFKDSKAIELTKSNIISKFQFRLQFDLRLGKLTKYDWIEKSD